MANWVSNCVTVIGPQAEIERLQREFLIDGIEMGKHNWFFDEACEHASDFDNPPWYHFRFETRWSPPAKETFEDLARVFPTLAFDVESWGAESGFICFGRFEGNQSTWTVETTTDGEG